VQKCSPLPAASRAQAVSVCAALLADVVSQEMEYGEWLCQDLWWYRGRLIGWDDEEFSTILLTHAAPPLAWH